MELYATLKIQFSNLFEEAMDETVAVVAARPLTAKEAIGDPERKDFPLIRGKEVMIEATYQGAKGQAFTDMPGNYCGTLREVVDLPLTDNFQRAVFVASLNACLRHRGLVSGTVHCKDKDPEICAGQLSAYVNDTFGRPKIAFVGYQPAMLAHLAATFAMRVIDLDDNNIGQQRFGLTIEGPDQTQAALSWSDLILATGSTCTNATIAAFLNQKPVVFYGVTIAGIAGLCRFARFCPCPG